MSSRRARKSFLGLVIVVWIISILACTITEQASVQTLAAQVAQTALAEGEKFAKTQAAALAQTAAAGVQTQAIALAQTAVVAAQTQALALAQTAAAGIQTQIAGPTSEPSYQVAAFYYPWYGSPQFNGRWIH